MPRQTQSLPYLQSLGLVNQKPTTGSPVRSSPKAAARAEREAPFRGDLDGDGAPDRAVYLFPDLPGQDVAGEHHFS